MKPAAPGVEVVLGQLHFALREEGQRSAEGSLVDQLFGVYLDGRRAGEVSFLAFYRPSLTIELPLILVWGGTRIFALDTESGAVKQQLDHSDEVRGLYPVAAGWCVVGELSITVFDRGFEAKRFEAQLDEVVLDSWWERSQLHLRDFQGRVLAFQEVGTAAGLRPLDAALSAPA